jgi:hypothetical protein
MSAPRDPEGTRTFPHEEATADERLALPWQRPASFFVGSLSGNMGQGQGTDRRSTGGHVRHDSMTLAAEAQRGETSTTKVGQLHNGGKVCIAYRLCISASQGV